MKLALWQASGIPGDVAANLAALEQVAQAAALAGATLLLTPECWLCGYNIGASVGELAESRDGESASRIARCAQRHGVAIAYGYAERDRPIRQVFNSVQVISADGTSVAHYRKTHLFGPMERAAFHPGSRLEPPFAFGGFNIALLICYDVEFPEAVRTLALMGSNLILVPTATSDDYAIVPRAVIPARAVENQLSIAYCNHAGVENGLRFLGGSCLVTADGAAVVSAGVGDALLVADVDPHVPDRQRDLYPYLIDRRPELYRSLVHQVPAQK